MAKTKEELEKERLMKNLMSPYSTESALLVGKANPSVNDQMAKARQGLYVNGNTETGRDIINRGMHSSDPNTKKYFEMTYPEYVPDPLEYLTAPSGGHMNPSITAVDEAIEKRDAEEQKKEEAKEEEKAPIDMGLLETIFDNTPSTPMPTYTSPSTPMPTYTTPAKVTGNQYTYNPITYERKTTDGDSLVKGVAQEVYDKANAAFVPSAEVQAAWQLVANSREKLAQGTTPYTDKLNQLIDSYQNRGDFNYDPNADMLYQQYLSSMQNAGQMAMKDTMGQAAALTGGYGSSYATAAANGAYNNYLQTANDNLVNFYNMALDKYRLEGDEALQNISLAQMQDENAYNRMLNEYNANTDFANTLYNRALGEHDRSVAQAQNTMDMMRGDYWQDIGNQLNTEMHNSDMTYKYDTLNQSAEEYANSTAQNEAWRQYQAQMDAYGTAQNEAWRQYQAQMDAYNAERQQANWQNEFDYNVAKDLMNSGAASMSSKETLAMIDDLLGVQAEANDEAVYDRLAQYKLTYNLTDEQIEAIINAVNRSATTGAEKVENHWGNKNDKYLTDKGKLITYDEYKEWLLRNGGK